MTFPNFSLPKVIFHDFPDLENFYIKFHDFSVFSSMCTNLNIQLHRYQTSFSILMAIFPGEPGLAGIIGAKDN